MLFRHDESPSNLDALQIVEALIEASRRRAELTIGFARTIFLLLVLWRYWNHDFEYGVSLGAEQRALLELPFVGGASLLSLVLLWAVHARGASWQLLTASTLLDVLSCGLALLPGVLYPWQAYRGLVHTADTAILPFISAAAGLRFSKPAFVVGAVANAASFTLLASLDYSLNIARIESFSPGAVHLYALYLGLGTVLGAILATRGQDLSKAAAAAVLRAEKARRGLLQVLAQNHDLKSVVSAVNLNLDMAARGPDKLSAESSVALKGNLERLKALLGRSRDEAYEALVRSEALMLSNVSEVVSQMVAAARVRHPSVHWQLHVFSASEAWVCGGQAGLERLMNNLLENAVEGDGTMGASTVTVRLDLHKHYVRLQVTDDGPGFSQDVLTTRSHISSSKRDGWGLGLITCFAAVQTGGGKMTLSNMEAGGACVTIHLPVSR